MHLITYRPMIRAHLDGFISLRNQIKNLWCFRCASFQCGSRPSLHHLHFLRILLKFEFLKFSQSFSNASSQFILLFYQCRVMFIWGVDLATINLFDNSSKTLCATICCGNIRKNMAKAILRLSEWELSLYLSFCMCVYARRTHKHTRTPSDVLANHSKECNQCCSQSRHGVCAFQLVWRRFSICKKHM